MRSTNDFFFCLFEFPLKFCLFKIRQALWQLFSSRIKMILSSSIICPFRFFRSVSHINLHWRMMTNRVPLHPTNPFPFYSRLSTLLWEERDISRVYKHSEDFSHYWAIYRDLYVVVTAHEPIYEINFEIENRQLGAILRDRRRSTVPYRFRICKLFRKMTEYL